MRPTETELGLLELVRYVPAVVLDTETTDLDGSVCQVAVVDVRSGRELLRTLVNPLAPIAPEAQQVHGITDAQVEDAPTWPEVWPRLQQVTAGRLVVAYNARFDQGRLIHDCRRWMLDTGRLGAPSSWWCLLTARTEIEGRRAALGSTHDALEDCRAARDLMLSMAQRATHRARIAS